MGGDEISQGGRLCGREEAYTIPTFKWWAEKGSWKVVHGKVYPRSRMRIQMYE